MTADEAVCCGYAHVSSTAYCAAKAALASAVECLHLELEMMAPAIRCLILEPGLYRTSIWANCRPGTDQDPAYSAFTSGLKAHVGRIADGTTAVPGDPDKGVERMIDLIKASGEVEGRKVPLRIQLGSDAWAVTKAKCDKTIQVLDEWRGVIESTDITKTS